MSAEVNASSFSEPAAVVAGRVVAALSVSTSSATLASFCLTSSRRMRCSSCSTQLLLCQRWRRMQASDAAASISADAPAVHVLLQLPGTPARADSAASRAPAFLTRAASVRAVAVADSTEHTIRRHACQERSSCMAVEAELTSSFSHRSRQLRIVASILTAMQAVLARWPPHQGPCLHVRTALGNSATVSC